MTIDPVTPNVSRNASPSAPPLSPSPSLPGTSIHAKWGWFVAFGVVTALFGLLALSSAVVSTIASVFTIGLFMIVAGGIEIGLGVAAHDLSAKAIWILVGLLYIVSGAFALAQPLVAATVFTLLLGASLLATGVVRIVAGVRMQAGPKAMVIFAGLVTTLLGGLILAGWPASSLVVLGTLLGIDLLFYGLTWIGVGLRLRKA